MAWGGISFFVSSNFPSNGVGIMSGDLFLTRVMTIFLNVTILEINVYVYIYIYEGREKGKGKREGKKGREKGKGKMLLTQQIYARKRSMLLFVGT